MPLDPKSHLRDLLAHGRTARDLAFKQADLRAEDLTGLRADALDLTDADLRSARFARAHWAGCTLRDARLEGADFTDAVLRMCNFDQARAENAIFLRAHLENGSARGARFDGASFEGAVLTDTDFSRASLQRAVLEGASASGADFRGADLRDARLGRAVLVDADLRGADLTGADLAGADLDGADLRGVVGHVPREEEEASDADADEPAPPLPVELRAMSDVMTPIVQEVLRTGGRRGVIDPESAKRLVAEAARLQGPPTGAGPDMATLKAVSRVLEGLGDDILPKLLSALRQPNGEGPPAEVQALIRKLSGELAPDATSAEDLLERLQRGPGRPPR